MMKESTGLDLYSWLYINMWIYKYNVYGDTHTCMSEQYVYNSQYLPDKCLEAAPCLYQQAYPAPSNWFLIATLTQRNSYSSVGQGSEPGHQLCQELRKHWKNARDMSKGHRSQAEDGWCLLPTLSVLRMLRQEEGKCQASWATYRDLVSTNKNT